MRRVVFSLVFRVDRPWPQVHGPTAPPQEVSVMTFGLMVTMPLPIETYEEIHAEVGATQAGRPVPGLLAHFARSTSDGYQLIEVWESKEQCDRLLEQVTNPIAERFAAGPPSPRRGAVNLPGDVAGAHCA